MRRVSIFILPALAVMVGFPSAVFAIGERMPEVRIYNAETGAEETRFPVLDGKFKGGISVAAGDVDGDGVDEIVVGAGPGVVL